MDTKEIAESEVVDMPMELAVFDPLKIKIQEAKEKNALLVFDYLDKQGNKDARSWVAHLRTLKAPVNELHRTGKAEALRYCKEWDNARNTMIAGIDELVEHHDKPLREIKDAEAKKKAEEEAKIKAEEERMEAERLAGIEAAQKKLAEETALLVAREAAFERKERETRISEEAKEQALVEASLARTGAEDKAKRDAIAAENRRIADVQRAKDEAAAEAQEKEQAAMEEQRIAREEKAAEEMAGTERTNDDKHRSIIHREIYSFLLNYTNQGLGITSAQAQAITQALIDGKIPHTTINY